MFNKMSSKTSRLFALTGLLLMPGIVAVVVPARPAAAATITALGVDANGGDTWRSTSDAKLPAFDPNGDNAYGTDGYVVYGKLTSASPAVVTELLPAYISGVAKPQPVYVDAAYSDVDDPTLPIAGTVANMFQTGLWYKPSSTAGTYYNFFTITLASPADFVLTAILDNHNSTSGYRVDKVKVAGPGGATAEITGLVDTGFVPDYAFFQISGIAGDVFTVSVSGPDSNLISTGLGFETTIPEPATLGLMAIGGLLIAFRGRKR